MKPDDARLTQATECECGDPNCDFEQRFRALVTEVLDYYSGPTCATTHKWTRS
jgi:hypothetical protein